MVQYQIMSTLTEIVYLLIVETYTFCYWEMSYVNDFYVSIWFEYTLWIIPGVYSISKWMQCSAWCVSSRFFFFPNQWIMYFRCFMVIHHSTKKVFRVTFSYLLCWSLLMVQLHFQIPMPYSSDSIGSDTDWRCFYRQ